MHPPAHIPILEFPLTDDAWQWRSQTLGSNIWIYDLTRETLARLTFGTTGSLNPAWTPDSKRVAFQAGSPSNLFGQLADGSWKAERLAAREYRDAPNSWSPDGKVLAFTETSPITAMDIMILPSDGKARPFLQTPFNEGAARFSPDGHWLAYVSDESGRYEIYVQPYPGPGEKWQVSTDGARSPYGTPTVASYFTAKATR